MNEIKMQLIRVGGMATSCYMIWREGRNDCVLIDPGAQAGRIRRFVQDKHVAAILLTHGHFDHFGAVDEMMEPDTELVIHQADAPMLTDPELNASHFFHMHGVCHEATRTVQEGDELTYAGLTFTVLHTPGHTAGCVCYRLEDYLFTGDTIMEEGVGRTDLPTGDDAQLDASLRRLQPLLETLICYGGHD